MTNKRLYTKDKSVKITFRCEPALSDWVRERSTTIGQSPSGFVRQILYQYFYGEKTFGNVFEKMLDTHETASAETAVVNEHK